MSDVAGTTATDWRDAEDLRRLERLGRADPRNPAWPARLGALQLAAARAAPDPDERYARASKALAALERALALTPDRRGRLPLDASAGWAAYFVDRADKAQRWAQALLDEVHVDDPSYGDAQHEAHTLLGLMALDQGDVKGAREHLLESLDVPAARAPVLCAAGPHVLLARRLLEKDERDAVLEYLETSGKFWKAGAQELADWSARISRGEPCDFSGAR